MNRDAALVAYTNAFNRLGRRAPDLAAWYSALPSPSIPAGQLGGSVVALTLDLLRAATAATGDFASAEVRPWLEAMGVSRNVTAALGHARRCGLVEIVETPAGERWRHIPSGEVLGLQRGAALEATTKGQRGFAASKASEKGMNANANRRRAALRLAEVILGGQFHADRWDVGDCGLGLLQLLQREHAALLQDGGLYLSDGSRDPSTTDARWVELPGFSISPRHTEDADGASEDVKWHVSAPLSDRSETDQSYS